MEKRVDLSKYNAYWFANSDIERLEKEREYIRVNVYLNNDIDDSTREQSQLLLWKFDEWLRKKRYGDGEWSGPNTDSRHGWYLPDDD